MSSADTAKHTARAARALISGTAARMGGRKATGQPVRRNSRHSGSRELPAWKAHNTFRKAENAARLRALEDYGRSLRQPGRPSPISANAVRIYRLLLRTRCRKTGQLDLSHATIARLVDLSVRTVQRILEILKEHGWLDWLRRTRPVEDPEPFGQQVEQDTNAYVLKLAAEAASRVRDLGGPAGVPGDQAQREADQAAEIAAMLDSLTAEELATFRAGSETPLAAALRALGRAVDRPHNATAKLAENPQEI